MNERDTALVEAADLILAAEKAVREAADRVGRVESYVMAVEADRGWKQARELAELAVSILRLGSPALSTRVAEAIQRTRA